MAIGLFAATGDPLAGGLILYASAGWPSIRSAIWLAKVDPIRERRRALIAFLISTAGWRAALVAAAAAFLGIIYDEINGNPANMRSFAALGIVIALGVTVAAGAGLVGIFFAMAKGIRVFVAPHLYSFSGSDYQRLFGKAMRDRYNHAIFVIGCSIFGTTFILGITLSVLLSNPAVVPAWSLNIGRIVLTVGFLVAIPLFAWLMGMLAAIDASECWPPYVETYEEYRAIRAGDRLMSYPSIRGRRKPSDFPANDDWTSSSQQ